MRGVVIFVFQLFNFSMDWQKKKKNIEPKVNPLSVDFYHILIHGLTAQFVFFLSTQSHSKLKQSCMSFCIDRYYKAGRNENCTLTLTVSL